MAKRGRGGVLFILAVVCAAGHVGPASALADRRPRGGETRHAKLSEKVRDEARRGARVDVLVTFDRVPGAAEKRLVRSLGGSIRGGGQGSSRTVPVRLPAANVSRLADDPLVDFVAFDAPVSTPETARPSVAAAIEASRRAAGMPPASVPESALTGAGVAIALVDSGVAPQIPGLVTEVDFVDSSGSPDVGTSKVDVGGAVVAHSTDPYGHGTLVASILVGEAGNRRRRHLVGVAPEASLVSVRVLDEKGRGMTSDVLAGLEWVRAHKDDYGIRVVNLSLGHPVYEPAEHDPLVHAVDALWDAGIVVVCSAGNAGRNGYGTITSPCNSRKVITVGALNDRQTADTGDDTVASYSSRGPTPIDRVAKPDILAPGNRILTSEVAGSYLDGMVSSVSSGPGRSGRRYVEVSGTSMAVPWVAGTAALMLQQDPALNASTVKGRLMLSARKTAMGDPFTTGAGALDALGALRTVGEVAQAPSPRVFPDAASGHLSVENTAVLWGNDDFTIMALWSSAVHWTDPTQRFQPLVWSDAVLWPDATLWPDAILWPDATLWPDAILWPDVSLFSDARLWPDISVWSQAVLWPEAALVDPDDNGERRDERRD